MKTLNWFMRIPLPRIIIRRAFGLSFPPHAASIGHPPWDRLQPHRVLVQQRAGQAGVGEEDAARGVENIVIDRKFGTI